MNIVKLVPAYKSIIWGGNKLKRLYGKQTDAEPLAETWELSLHKDGQSTLVDGTPLSEAANKKDLGNNCDGFPFFPVLVKLIDANDRLSVQVHPDDEYALKNENSLGKTEMWYVADADEGAGIFLGFRENITKKDFEKAISEKTLCDHLQFIPVKRGDCYFIPSGTIHAIGKGCLICEIQQNSNITYRVYDYGRKGSDGKERELHVNKALDVTRLEKYTPQALDIPTKEGILKGASKFFTATLIEADGEKRFEGDTGSFRCFTCLEGEGRIGNVEIKKGDSVFAPASDDGFTVFGNFVAIMTTVRKYYKKTESYEGYVECRIENDLGETLAFCKTENKKVNIEWTFRDLLYRCGLTDADVE